MIPILEAKADIEKLYNYVQNDDVVDKFLDMRQKLKSPYNDIYYWLKKDPSELKDYLNSFTSNTEKVKADKSGADLIYQDKDWKVYHIKTYEASVYYGKNTQWCISGSKRWDNGGDGRRFFNQYTKHGVEFYFYINKDNEKYALALYRSGDYEVFNSVDDRVGGIPDAPVIEGLPNISLKVWDIVNGILRKYDSTNSEVIVPDSVTEIGYNAFSWCESLKSIVISNSVTEIGEGAFAFCKNLQSIKIPNSVTEISGDTFKGCYSLMSIVIPDSVTEIGDYAFYSCRSLKSVKIPDSVTEIGKDAFALCKNLQSIKIPNSVTEISGDTFAFCKNLRSIKIPDSVTEIGEYAFYNCINLKSVKIPNSVTKIDNTAFKDCKKLTVQCYEGSTAEKYARTHNIDYDYIT